MLWLLKLTLAPLLVAVATLVARRWGPKAGGILVGFPLTTGPIFLFLAIDQGLDFAQRAVVGILLGLVGLSAFALAYALVSLRTGWFGSLVVAAVGFFVVSVGVGRGDMGMVGSAGAAFAALLFVTLMIPRPQLDAVTVKPPWWDLWLRMSAAAVLTLTITAAATRLGPVFSGIVGTYPVVSTVVMTFTHQQWGREAAVAMLRGTVLSWIAFVSCFLAIGLTLKPYGLAPSIGIGAAAAVVTSFLVLRIDRLGGQQRSKLKAIAQKR
jgi:hypothetical protein